MDRALITWINPVTRGASACATMETIVGDRNYDQRLTSGSQTNRTNHRRANSICNSDWRRQIIPESLARSRAGVPKRSIAELTSRRQPSKCRSSSVVEQRIRNAWVVSSNLIFGSFYSVSSSATAGTTSRNCRNARGKRSRRKHRGRAERSWRSHRPHCWRWARRD